jgi:glycine cleavage system aminomethyltransferase T
MTMQRRSPLHYHHLAAGAVMAGNDWPLPSRYSLLESEVQTLRERCGLIDFSTTSKWDLKGPGLATFLGAQVTKEVDWATHRTAGALPSAFGGAAGFWWVPTGDRTFLVAERDTAAGLEFRLRTLELPPSLQLTEVTSGYAHFVLAGPLGREVLSRVTSLNLTETGLSSGSCAQAALARCHCAYVRLDAGDVPVYHLLLTRDTAEFVWEALLDAGRGAGLAPVGVLAWEQLRGSACS